MPNECAFLSAEALDAAFDALEREAGEWRQMEVVGPRGVGKTYFCAAYRKKGGYKVADREMTRLLVRHELGLAERVGSWFLPRRQGADIRARGKERLNSRLTPDERAYLLRLDRLLQPPLTRDLDPDRRAALEYCAQTISASVARAAHLRRGNVKALLDEGVLKLLMGFLRWYPGDLPDAAVGEVRDCLLHYPGERRVLFLEAPADVVVARRILRGDPPPASEPSHEASSRLLQTLCEQANWRVFRVDV